MDPKPRICCFIPRIHAQHQTSWVGCRLLVFGYFGNGKSDQLKERGQPNVDLTIKSADTPQRNVERVRSVGCANDDDVCPSLHPIHQCEELRDDTFLDLALSLLALRCDRVDFIDEDDGRSVLL